MQAKKALWSLLMALMASGQFLQQVNAAEEPGKQGITLTFLFDSTGSMSDELNQVKAAMQDIFDYMKVNRESEIANYVLVEFNDPSARLLTMTTDSAEYRRKLGTIRVYGGDDCPEMAMKGLKIALENSLPYSYIFAFTDASAKDYRRKHEIENIIQRTKSKVVFVLTGQCDNESDPAYQVYYSIAKISNGHVFNLLKNEVNKVLDFVKIDTTKKAVIDSGSIPSGTPVSVKTPVDESVKEFTVTVTGKKPTIDLEDPSGKKTDGKTILNLESAVSKKVEDPKPGNWTVVVGSSSPGDFVLTADSNFTFTAGFSLKPTVDMAETSPRPLIGTANELLIKIKNVTNTIELTEIKVKDTDNNVLKSFKLLPVSANNGIYKATEKFLPPTSVFRLEVLGKDSKNNLIKRLSDSGITPQPPAPPIITLEKELTATLRQPFKLLCRVESLVPFSGSWTRKGKTIVPEQKFPQSSKIQYHIENTTMATGGLYTCKARNVAGVSTKEVKLNVQVPPPLVKTPHSIELIDKRAGKIPCSVESELDYQVNWQKRIYTGEYVPVNGSKFSINYGNLVISSVEKADEGKYKCLANSIFGKGESEVMLVVTQVPQVTVSEDKKFKAKDIVLLYCNVSSTLPLKIVWKKSGVVIEKSDERLSVEKDNILILKIENAKKENEGVYECEAKNSIKSVSKTTKLQYVEGPIVKIRKPTSLALAGSNYSLQCLVTGFPKPVISWLKDGNQIGMGEWVKISDDGKLTFSELLNNHTGVYQCIAQNDVGKSDSTVTITVFTTPQIEHERESSEELSVLEQNKELTCKVIRGEPPPILQWFKDGEKLDAHELKMIDGTIHKNGSLTFSYIKSDNEGTYECEATNMAGKTRKIHHIKVHIPPGFTDDQRIVIKVRPGTTVSLPCEANGIPKPATIWMKDNKRLVLASNMALSSEDDSLLILSPNINNNGTYECIAINSAGRNTRVIDLLVQSAPRILPTSNNMDPQRGTEVLLRCEVLAFPVADIKWYKNGVPFRTDSITRSENNSSIRMIADLLSTGEYVCVASNEAGKDRFTINVTVTEPPSFKNAEEYIQASRGETVTLSCYTDAVPPARYYWAKHPHDEPIESDSVIIFENVDNDFAGIYRCEAVNTAGYAQKVIVVTVYTPPRIYTDLPESYLLRIGRNFSIPCFAEGDPHPSVKWLKNGKPIVRLTEDEGLLSIIDGSKDDEGIYTCVAENYEGTDEKNVELLFEAPPKMYEEYVPIVEGNEGDIVTISCPAMSGIPSPTIYWMKDGEVIQPSRKIVPKDKNRSLRIKRIKQSDKGTYSCIASNSAGTAQAYIPLEVNSAPVFKSKGSKKDINQLQGTILNLDCTTSGTPFPKVSWFRNNHPLIPAANGRAEMISGGQVMRILNTTKGDKGMYKCIVENKAGLKERTFQVKLYVRPKDEGYIVDEDSAVWGPWSSWSECSSPCGHSEQVRTRVCSSEIVPCDGLSEDWRICYVGGCKVDGGWSQWGNWSKCSHSCGFGKRFRERSCSNPTPKNEGNLCHGKNLQHEACNITPCPVDGSWSEWSKWHICTGPCFNSTMKRMRKCTNPSPAFGGKPCRGTKIEYKQCTLENCPVDGGWSEWSAWSPCSASCGHSVSFRERSCNNPKPKFHGEYCKGNNKETRKCDIPLCDDIPLQVLIKVVGAFNGHKIPEFEYLLNVTDLEVTRLVVVKARNVLKHSVTNETNDKEAIRGWYLYLPHAVTPVTWLTAYQKDKAINGFTLTKGVFNIQTVVNFKTGENISISHVGYGKGPDGILKLDAHIQGNTPLFPKRSSVKMEPYEENYIQTGPGELFASSQSTVEGGGISIPFSWTRMITYDVMLGKLPSVVEVLTVQNNKIRNTEYKEQGRISIVPESTCPRGFKLSKQGYCNDVDECSDRKLNKCHITQTCENYKGSYSCACPPGLTASNKGGKCTDVNECAVKPSVCSHRCENLEGSFQCLCPPGLTLLDSKTICTSTFPRERTIFGEIENWISCSPNQREVDGVCKDKEPCIDNDHICEEEEICVNMHGLYNCIPYPCPPDFFRMNNSQRCIKYCNVSACDSAAINYEIITPIILQLQKPIAPYIDLTTLTIETETLNLKNFFHITENEEGKPFRVKILDGRGVIYSTKYLPAGRQYRIVVLASVFDKESTKILNTNKFVVTFHTTDDI